jgi:cobalt/nickel transport system permease protein
MICAQQQGSNSLICRLDPRLRVFSSVVFSLIVVLSQSPISLIAALLYSLLAVIISGLPRAILIKRILKLNIVILLLFLFVGPQSRSRVGIIALKSNGLLLWLSAFISTIDITSLGHALNHLKVPDKLTHLFLTSVRYIDVLFMEYQRLIKAMKVRGFKPAMNRYTYRMYSYLVGMLLVKSFDRSERIFAAMKCRGFSGHFYVLDHFHWQKADSLAVIIFSALCFSLIGLEWMVL